MTYPHVLTEWNTLNCLYDGQSIARYGDGELKLCMGGKCVFQGRDPVLKHRLLEILKSDNDRCLIGIPRLNPLEDVNITVRKFWEGYTLPKVTDFYDPKKVYGSSFITRPDNIQAIDTPAYYQRVKSLWEGRHVVVVHGNTSRSHFDKETDLLKNARSIERIVYSSDDAFRSYDAILAHCLIHDTNKLFILGLGPTATVLAYDLSLKGYQALDLGHFGMFYRRHINDLLDL